MSVNVKHIAERLASVPAHVAHFGMSGRVIEAKGTLIRVAGLDAKIGEICELSGLTSGFKLNAEVVGFEGETLLLTPMGETSGLAANVSATALGHAHQIRVGPHLLGRIVNGMGHPIDGKGDGENTQMRSVHARPPSPLERQVIHTPMAVGVRSIDALLSCGMGQRLGIFAPAGCGKSTLLGTIARNATADVIVIALVGERGREVNEFIQDCLGAEGLARSVVVVATSDSPALERAKAAQVATTIAEYFREQGKAVLLLVDSVTRYARALREIGLACGEPPTRRAYPPSVFSSLPQLFERAGYDRHGSITAFYTVLQESEDDSDPIAEEVRSLLDGHIVLTRKLAAAGHFPAIDVLASVSRVMQRVAAPDHITHATRVRTLLARYQELELLVRMGEFKRGFDAEADAAIDLHDALNNFLRQNSADATSHDDCLFQLQQLVS